MDLVTENGKHILKIGRSVCFTSLKKTNFHCEFDSRFQFRNCFKISDGLSTLESCGGGLFLFPEGSKIFLMILYPKIFR